MAVSSAFWALAGSVSPRGVEVEAELVAERLEQPEEVVGDVRRWPTAGSRPRRGSASGSGTTSSGSTSIRVPRPVHSGQAPNGRVERERPRLELVDVERVVVGAGQLLGEPPLAVRVVLGAGRRSRGRPAAGQAERGLDRVGEPALGRSALTASRSTTTSMVCFSCFSSLGGSVERVDLAVDPGPGEALGLQLANRSTYSPLRPRITGASTWKRVPSSQRRAPGRRSAAGVCRAIGSPQTGQCGRPARA